MFDSLFAFFFAGMPVTRLLKNPFSHRTNTWIQHRSRLTINPPVMADIFRVGAFNLFKLLLLLNVCECTVSTVTNSV